jgi:hypothetical protein
LGHAGLQCGARVAQLLRRLSAFEPQISRLWDVIAPMNSSKVYEVIAGIAMIITGLFLGYDELWGALMILLGVLFLILWLARTGSML